MLIGEYITLSCSSVTEVKPNFRLYHNTKLIAKNNVGNFTVLFLADKQLGVYSCVASNRFGKDTAALTLRLYGKLIAVFFSNFGSSV